MYSQEQWNITVDKKELKRALAPFPCDTLEEIQAACRLIQDGSLQSLISSKPGHPVEALSIDGTIAKYSLSPNKADDQSSRHLTRLFLLGKIKTIGGNFTLEGEGLITFPPGQRIKGNLLIRDAPNLAMLPLRTFVEGNLVISNCDILRGIGSGAYVGGSLIISQCHHLTYLPSNFHVTGDIVINNEAVSSVAHANQVLSQD